MPAKPPAAYQKSETARRAADQPDPVPPHRPELTLDPPRWEPFAATAHRALNDAIDRMRTIGRRPPWRPVPEGVKQKLSTALPEKPRGLDEVYATFRDHIAPYPTGNGHPRFWGWVMGTGTAEGMLADLLASSMNPHLGGYDQSATLVEEQVIDWLKEILGYPAAASGLLVSGGTAANLTGLAVARGAKGPTGLRETGLASGPRLCAYGSSETHSWVEKSCDLLGLGRDAFRRLTVDREGRLDPRALRSAIHEDRELGLRPFCVVANAGTVDGGVIDDLDLLADLCQEEDLWLHVDGAFGALAALSPRLRPRLAGLERADSVAFDLHKWGFLQYEVGVVLVHDAVQHRATFSTRASYLDSPGRGIQPAPLPFPELGLQLSRGFRALKVWFSLQVHGTERIGQVIEQNVDQAQHLVARIDRHPDLQRLGPAPLNVVCFRYMPGGHAGQALDQLNREILVRIQEQGIAIPSSTRREGQFCLRVAITNHRTRTRDLDALVEAVLRIGQKLVAESGRRRG